MFNKKGLELPITAIIVLIISITFLGLAIYFIKTLFTGGTEILSGELAKIKGELRKNMEESGESFIFSAGDELEIKRGEPLKFYIGVKNTAAAENCYRIAIKCLKPFTPAPEGKCTTAQPTDAFVGGTDINGIHNSDWFPKMLSELTVPSGEVEISPVTVQIAGAQPDTYLMEADLFEALGKECNNFQSTQDPKLSKRFHIVLH